MSAPSGAPRSQGPSPTGRGRGGRRGSSVNNTGGRGGVTSNTGGGGGGRGRGRGNAPTNPATESLHKAVLTNNAINTAQTGRGTPTGHATSHQTLTDPKGRGTRIRGVATSSRGHPNKSVRFNEPKPTTPQPAARGVDVYKEFIDEAAEKFQTLKQQREGERSRAIRDGFLADPEKKTSLEDAITPVGTCTEMCPEFERVERIVQMMVDKSEKVHNDDTGRDLPSHDNMVKRFRRSAAGNDEQLPSDIRTPATLKATLDYLLDTVIGDGHNLASVHKFVWDRTRAIRNDFSIQQVTEQEDVRLAVDCFERIARFHILSLHQLSNPDVLGNEQFDAHQDREQLNNTLLSLMYYYDDNRSKQSFPNEAEFRAYCILFELQSHQPDLEDRLQSWSENLLKDGRVVTAFKLYSAAASPLFEHGPLRPTATISPAQSNTGAFWTLLRSQAVSYLMACVAEIYFAQIRYMTLQGLWASTRSTPAAVRARAEDWTTEELAKVLHFDTAHQAVSFCKAFKLRFSTNSQGTQYLDLTLGVASLDQSSIPTRQVFSHHAVETKRYNRTLVAMINGISVSSAIRQGLVDTDNDQHGEDTTRTEHESTLFIPENNGPASEPPVEERLALNPVASIFTPGAGQSSLPTGTFSPFTPPAFGTPANTDTFAGDSANISQQKALSFFTQRPPASQTLVGQTPASPYAGLFGNHDRLKTSSTPFGMTTTPFGTPTPPFETPSSASASPSSFQDAVALANSRTPPRPTLASSGFSQASQTSLPGHSLSQTPDEQEEAPQQPALPSSFARPQPLSSLVQPTPFSHPHSSLSLSPFGRPTTTNILTPPVIDFSRPPPRPPSSPRPHQVELSSIRKTSLPDFVPPSSSFLPTIVPPPRSGGRTTVDPTAELFGLRQGGRPTAGLPLQASTPTSTSTSTATPTSIFIRPVPTTESHDQDPYEHIPFMTKPDPIGRNAAIELVANRALLQTGGLLQEYLEFTLPVILKRIVKEFEQATEVEAIRNARHIILSKKYFRRWQKLAWHKLLNRRAEKRRRLFTETIRSEEAKRVKRDSEVAAIVYAQHEKAIIQAAQKLEREKKEAEKRKAEKEAAKSRIRMTKVPSPGQIAGHKRKSMNAEQRDERTDSPRKILKGHRRSRTVDTTNKGRPRFSTSIHLMGRSASSSPHRQSIFSRRSTLASPTSASPPRKLDTTRTDYFRLKALGVDPDTPWVPDTRKDLERKEREQAEERAALRASSRLRGSSILEAARQVAGSATETGTPVVKLSRPEPVKAYNADDDELLQEIRKMRQVMGEQTEWFKTQGQLIEKEVEQEELQRSMSSPDSRRTSIDGLIKVNGHDVRPAQIQPGRSMSRSEERIRRTGAHGLATKPIGGSDYLAVAMSKRSAARLRNSEAAQANGTAKGQEGATPPDRERHGSYNAGPDERFDGPYDDVRLRSSHARSSHAQSPHTPTHLKPSPTNGTNADAMSLQPAPQYQLANGTLANDEDDLEYEEEELLEEDDLERHQPVYHDDADEELEYEEEEESGEEEDYIDGEEGGDISRHPYLQLPAKHEEAYEDAPTPFGGSQVSHATSGGGTADDALVLSD